MAEGMEWVEIIEPRTKKHMYANLITGECVWDQPLGQRVKKTDSNQWWELYDKTTARFYYYNATNQSTVWHRPENCDIIPLAKLQTLKQNTEVHDDDGGKGRKRESISTQTAEHVQNGIGLVNTTNSSSAAPIKVKDGRFDGRALQQGSVRKLSSQTQTTPQSSPKDAKRHLSHHHHPHKCTHAHPVRSTISHGNADHAATTRNVAPVPVQRQHSAGFQQRQQPSRDPDYFEEDAGDIWNNSSDRLSNPPGGSSRLVLPAEPSHRTPSPRSPAIGLRDAPVSGSLARARMYENHGLDERNDHFDNPIPSTSSSFSKSSPSPVVLSRRQRSFDSKNGFFEPMEGSLPFHGRRDNVYQAPSVPSGVRSVESTPRVQRRNNIEVPLPQINELNNAIDYQQRQRHDVFAMSGGTPMQSRKRRSLPKTNGSPQMQAAPLTPTAVSSQPASGSSSQSHSSLESKRSLFGAKHAGVSLSSDQRSYSTFANQQQQPPQIVPVNGGRQEKSPVVPFYPRDQLLNYVSGMPTFGKPLQQLKRTISVDRHDLKSPLSDGSSNKPFSPQLQRRATSKVSPRLSPGELEEDRKAEELLRAAKEYQANNYLLSGQRVNGHRYQDDVPVPRQCISTQHQNNLNSDTDSESAGDADVEDSDELDEEEDDDDDDLALDPSGNNRYGHLSPSQLRTHPNYCAIDRVMKSPHFHSGLDHRGNNHNHHQSSDDDDDDENDNFDLVTHRDKVQFIVDNTRHASLRRKPHHTTTGAKLPGLEKSQSVQTELSAQQLLPRPMSIVLPTQSEASLISSTKSSSPVCRPFYSAGVNGSATLTRDRSIVEKDLESGRSAQNLRLNDHTKGIFRKKVSIASLLAWSKDSIKKPLIMTTDKSAKKEACVMFRMVQTYMGDRKAKDNKSQDETALDLTRIAWQKATLRDELFIQICKQTTDNRKPESLRRGWELLAICLAFFPPSAGFFGYLHTYISKFQSPACDNSEVQVSHYASHSLRRLERMSQTGAKRGSRKPTVDEIQQARVQIFHPSMFGNTLDDVMQLQKERFPDRSLPWIQTTLSDEVLRLGGARTEGIFRVPGDIDEVNSLKVRMDKWNLPDCCDPHIPSSLLKLWYRELYEPLIPARFYDQCILNCNNPLGAVRLAEGLPEINRLVLTYLIHFLQEFAQSENVHITKMDTPNLAMVMAPNCLRCMSDEPQVIFENTRKEMAFMRTLMQHLDTSWIEGIR